MKITWLGHASFRIEIEDQVLLIDPWLSGNPLFPEDREGEATAGTTAILVTHGHGEYASDVPDSLGVLARLASGTRVTYRVSAVTAAAAPMRVAMYGTEGSLLWKGGADLTIVPLGSEPATVQPHEGADIGWRV